MRLAGRRDQGWRAGLNDWGTMIPEAQGVGIAVAPRTLRQARDTRYRFYRQVWKRSETPTAVSVEPATWIIFTDSIGLGKQISLQLNGAAHRVIEVTPGKAFTRVGKNRYVIHPSNRADYDRLIGDIRKRGNDPQKIMHLWSVGDESRKATDETLSLSFYSLLYLSQAVQEQELVPLNIAVISNRLQRVLVETPHNAARAALLGVRELMNRQVPGITCRSIDCDPVTQGMDYVAVQLIAEQCSQSDDPVVAYRGEDRWIQAIEACDKHSSSKRAALKQRGVYLIAGGLGDLGLAISESLARDCRARLVLVDTSALPARDEWSNALRASGTAERVKHVLQKVSQLEALGAEVFSVNADISRQSELTRAFELAEGHFGTIDGVVRATCLGERSPSDGKSIESAARILSQNVQGALVLNDFLQLKSVDFLALFSSEEPKNSSEPMMEHVGASAFQEAFASCLANTRTLAVTYESGQTAAECQLAELLAQFLGSDISSVIVSSKDLVRTEAATRTDAGGSRALVKEDVEAVLMSWWRELLALDEINLDDDFFELGGHSLIGVSLFSKIKKTYGLELGLATLFEARTIRDLARLIRQGSKPADVAGTTPWSPLVPIQPRGRRRPLYVISGLGGNVVKFHSLALHLGEDQPMFGLLPRGLDGKSPYHTRIEDIAADYVKAIRAKQPHGPYQVVGYSFGGIVAFEVAQQIVAQGERVSLLGLFDTLEWHYGDKVDESLRPGERLDTIKEHLNEIFFGRDGRSYLSKLVSGKLLDLKHKVFRATGRTIAQENVSIEEINAYAGAGYRPKPFVGKLVLFRSEKRSVTDGNDPLLGWGDFANGGVDVHHVPSTHFNMLQEPAVKVVADQLRTRLEA
jgi:thioesterase domain-containing protein/acyl carrier protein